MIYHTTTVTIGGGIWDAGRDENGEVAVECPAYGPAHIVELRDDAVTLDGPDGFARGPKVFTIDAEDAEKLRQIGN